MGEVGGELMDYLAYVVLGIELIGTLVIVLGVGRAFVRYFRIFLRKETEYVSALRLDLGRVMVLGLEFQVAADIVRTALSREWNDILVLGALIALRTILNFLLEREMESIGMEHFYVNKV
ncbi:MAG: DUF1622 domain-containing protein [Anaerolineales bacterium]